RLDSGAKARPYLSPTGEHYSQWAWCLIIGVFHTSLWRNTMSNTNIANQKIRWFNAHTEACGYLNGFKEVLPTAGQAFKPFWASTFCLLEGNPESPRKTYVSVSIANPKVVELLAPFSDQLNAEESRVFVTARLADLSAEPFVFGAYSQRAGHIGVNWKGKLLML